VQQIEVELSIGQMVQIGNQIVTLIDIEGSEISVRIDPFDPGDYSNGEFTDTFGGVRPK
jgi:hypothetical protein